MSDDIGMTLTEKGAMAYQTSGNPFVDFFMMFTRGITNDAIDKYMQICWQEDPRKAIAIIFQGRDRQHGKKEKNISTRAMIWLRKNKYKTYQKNIANYINKYGCWKDISYIAMKMPRDHSFETQLFAKQLEQDIQNLHNKKYQDISLCAKWASSEKDKYDVDCNLAHAIASELFPDNFKTMQRYRKEILVPLRKHMNIVEAYMTANQWKQIKYENVPAVATKRLRNAFVKHDEDGYNEFLKKVASGEKKMKTTGILPHELVNYYLQNEVYDETIELQWKALVENVKQQGLLHGMIPIVDVSGSMTMMSCGTGSVSPIQVSIALGLLTAECTSGYFANKVISFHTDPSIHVIKGNTLKDKVNMIKNIPAGLKTNFEAVFKMLIDAGKTFNLSQEQMPEKIIVFSDMQFDEASSTGLQECVLHDTITQKYAAAGYKPPKFIYWNLSSQYDETFPVKAVSSNVAMISGFSEQLLKVFMNSDNFDPASVVNEILSKYMLDVIIDDDDV
jgi:hypothetical protein